MAEERAYRAELHPQGQTKPGGPAALEAALVFTDSFCWSRAHFLLVKECSLHVTSITIDSIVFQSRDGSELSDMRIHHHCSNTSSATHGLPPSACRSDGLCNGTRRPVFSSRAAPCNVGASHPSAAPCNVGASHPSAAPHTSTNSSSQRSRRPPVGKDTICPTGSSRSFRSARCAATPSPRCFAPRRRSTAPQFSSEVRWASLNRFRLPNRAGQEGRFSTWPRPNWDGSATASKPIQECGRGRQLSSEGGK